MQAPAGAPWPRPSHDEGDEEHVSAGASSSTTVSELVAMRDAPQEVSLLHRCGAVQHVAIQDRQGKAFMSAQPGSRLYWMQHASTRPDTLADNSMAGGNHVCAGAASSTPGPQLVALRESAQEMSMSAAGSWKWLPPAKRPAAWSCMHMLAA